MNAAITETKERLGATYFNREVIFPKTAEYSDVDQYFMENPCWFFKVFIEPTTGHFTALVNDYSAAEREHKGVIPFPRPSNWRWHAHGDPYQAGFRAYRERKGITDNPYPRPADSAPRPSPDDSAKSDYWRWYDGWRKADREDGN
jgi:hypothetical protein